MDLEVLIESKTETSNGKIDQLSRKRMHPPLLYPCFSFCTQICLIVLPVSECKTNKSILSNPVHLPNTVLSAFTYIFSFNGSFAYLLQWKKWNWAFGCSSPSLSALAFRSH